MADAFTDALDLTPYTFIANQISRDPLNVASAQKLQKAWQQEVARYFPRGPNQQADLADPNLLDHAIWYVNTNCSRPYPGQKRILYPKEIRPAESDERVD